MIIRPRTNQIETINDIENIKQARRFIFIYKYRSPKQALMTEMDSFPSENVYMGDTLYGIYIVNLSTIDGVGYIVPSKYMVHSRNGYRGSYRDAILANGQINPNARVNLYTASYANRIHNKTMNSVLEGSFNTISTLDFVLIGLLGAFTYGPQMMIGGLCAVESSSKKVASAATGFTGTFGYIGAVLSATGTGFMVDKFGWNGALSFWIASAVICITICVMLWKNEKQKVC